MISDLILSEGELRQLTGYKRAADQVRELRRQGFYRARQAAVTRAVILERAHNEAVCGGVRKEKEPELQPLTRTLRRSR